MAPGSISSAPPWHNAPNNSAGSDFGLVCDAIPHDNGSVAGQLARRAEITSASQAQGASSFPVG